MGELRFVAVDQHDPLAEPLLAELDSDTAELKRVWTDRRHRRRGHANALLHRLETEAAANGYRRVYLSTGDRQPEAEKLYLANGYTRLAEPLPAEREVYPVAFLKVLR